ncbi:unnamed protein product [Chilo suppressalis]|uniref:C2H2-type domain-containing protein n=1 Tax=Chilo suppressalis TaxID=168631 RepID=A0ABN8L8E2_CHISP|nr:unnamed protein product [Chilo suppressalis]
MAGNKINTKTKGREDKSKTNKGMIQNIEDSEDADFSLLRKPIFTSVTGFAQARKIFDLATEELKGLISNECDLLYECKVCRNIFRSLANFISHKRVYCTEQYSTTVHGQFFKMNSTDNEMMKIKKIEESYFESLKDKEKIEVVQDNEADNRIPLTKDLTAILEKIMKSKEKRGSTTDESQLILQKIPNSSVAVFQNIDSVNEKHDKMKAQVEELDNILSQDKAVLQSDGKFKIQSNISSDTDNVIQISDDEENNSTNILKCKICGHNFSTLKTLKFHMKYKHLESRLVYSCPDCLEIFSTSWSVYRHLFKVHRKTAAQIRRLRESIQSKAFKMNNPPAFYEKRKNTKPPTTQKISEEERLDQENQAWVDNVEGDSEIPRCFGCGRTFERRAALAAHTHTCQPRSRALARRPQETKKIEIQIRKDYNKGPAANLNLPIKTTESNENKTPNEEVTSINKQDKEVETKELENGVSEELLLDTSESLEKVKESPEKPLEALSEVPKPLLKLPFAQHIEKSNLSALRLRIQPDIEVNKLLCKKCDIQHDTVHELYDHMAGHYKWMRYACKLCNFKHYNLEKLPEHVKIVHKLKGDNDFYFSTVKAIDGNEALELSECVDENTDVNSTSPDSRRQSRCSSDSSRLSDDSSSSSTRPETGARKRKMCQLKGSAKRKRSTLNNDYYDEKCADFKKETNGTTENYSPPNVKTFEENSSDMDEIEDKISKISKQLAGNHASVASRRPVRKKTKPKNEDFEYDLSNLLKMEAQGYRDSQSLGTKTNQPKDKKKPTQDNANYYEILNRDCSGALATLSKRAVENFTAQMKNSNFTSQNAVKEPKSSNIFVRPMLPKGIYRGERYSPNKKDVADDCSSPPKDMKMNKVISDEAEDEAGNEVSKTPEKDVTTGPSDPVKPAAILSAPAETANANEEKVDPNSTIKPNLNIPAVVPIKFRRQSLEVMKNPLINKNISEFKNAGMKTKILVIKPINRNKDGTSVPKAPLKFQTIKLKDPSKCLTPNEEKASDQVVVVKVPAVDCAISLPNSDKNAVNCDENTPVVDTFNNNDTSEQLTPPIGNKNINKADISAIIATKSILGINDMDIDENDKIASNESKVETEQNVVNETKQPLEGEVIEAAT